jgi:hypothetical protein
MELLGAVVGGSVGIGVTAVVCAASSYRRGSSEGVALNLGLIGASLFYLALALVCGGWP